LRRPNAPATSDTQAIAPDPHQVESALVGIDHGFLSRSRTSRRTACLTIGGLSSTTSVAIGPTDRRHLCRFRARGPFW
jgi:hypothetical protein